MTRCELVRSVAALIVLIPQAGRSQNASVVKPVYRVPDEMLSFDGTSEYKVIPFEPAMALPAKSGKLTVAAWVRTRCANRPQMVLKREGAWHLGVGGWDQPRGFFAVWSPDIHSIVSEPLLVTGQWQHIAGSYDGATFTFFLNGRAISSEPARYGKPVPNDHQPLWIGANISADKPGLLFSGEVGDLSIWDQALTAEGIAMVASHPPRGVMPAVPVAAPAATAPTAPVLVEGQLSGVALGVDIGVGIRLQRIGDRIASSGGRVFSLLANGRKIDSDQVSVRREEVAVAADGWSIPFDLPDGLGSGLLRFYPSGESGVVNTRLELTNGGPASVWRVLFPLIEGVSLDEKPAGDLEFFFPVQEGWLGQGECSLSAAYGTRAWLPVIAAWNPTGTGLSLQIRDREFDVHSLLFRNAPQGGRADTQPTTNDPGQIQKRLYGESFHPDGARSAEAFPCEATGLTMGIASLEFPLGITQTWKSKAFAIQTYDGIGLFKTPLASYGKWARSTWWQHRPMVAWARDSFLAIPVHERGGGRGIEKGFWDGNRWLLGDQVEAYARDMGGHPFPELSYWWKQGDEIKSGPFAGRFYPHTLGDYDFEPRFGGVEKYRAEIERVHKAGARVCLYMQGRLVWKQSKVGAEHAGEWAWMDRPGHRNLDWSGEGEGEWKTDYWNFCPQAKGWQEHLRSVAQRILSEAGADAVRLDSEAESLVCYNTRHEHSQNPLNGLLQYLSTIRQGVDAAGTDKSMWGEFCGSDAAAMYFDGTLAQGSDPDLPLVDKMCGYGISPFRFVYPEVKCIEWGNALTSFDYLSKRFFFNGIGMTVGDLSAEQLQILTHRAETLRSVGDVIGSMDCEPIVRSHFPGLLANRFTLGDREVYTLWNRSEQSYAGVFFSIPGTPDRHFVELLSSRECPSIRKGAADTVEITLPKGEVAAIGVFPRIIEARGKGVFECPAPMTIEAVDLSTRKIIASGSGKVEVPDSVRGTTRIFIRAIKDGYLVQDLVDASH